MRRSSVVRALAVVFAFALSVVSTRADGRTTSTDTRNRWLQARRAPGQQCRKRKKKPSKRKRKKKGSSAKRRRTKKASGAAGKGKAKKSRSKGGTSATRRKSRAWKKGDKVSARWPDKDKYHGRWYDGTIVQKIRGTPAKWRVHFDKYSKKYDRNLRAKEIRPRSGKKVAGGKSGGKTGSKYKRGQEVMVKWGKKGCWWKATILSVKSPRRYKVHYDGYGKKYDEVVGPQRIETRRTCRKGQLRVVHLGRIVKCTAYDPTVTYKGLDFKRCKGFSPDKRTVSLFEYERPSRALASGWCPYSARAFPFRKMVDRFSQEKSLPCLRALVRAMYEHLRVRRKTYLEIATDGITLWEREGCSINCRLNEEHVKNLKRLKISLESAKDLIPPPLEDRAGMALRVSAYKAVKQFLEGHRALLNKEQRSHMKGTQQLGELAGKATSVSGVAQEALSTVAGAGVMIATTIFTGSPAAGQFADCLFQAGLGTAAKFVLSDKEVSIKRVGLDFLKRLAVSCGVSLAFAGATNVVTRVMKSIGEKVLSTSAFKRLVQFLGEIPNTKEGWVVRALHWAGNLSRSALNKVRNWLQVHFKPLAQERIRQRKWWLKHLRDQFHQSMWKQRDEYVHLVTMYLTREVINRILASAAAGKIAEWSLVNLWKTYAPGELQRTVEKFKCWPRCNP